MIEIYKPIPNHPDYQVSNLMNIRSKKRGSWKQLKPRTTIDGKHADAFSLWCELFVPTEWRKKCYSYREYMKNKYK